MGFPKIKILLLAFVLIIGSIWYLESKKVDTLGSNLGDTAITVSGMTAEEKAKMYDRGQEISSPDGFINVDSVTVEGEIAKGNIVLIDFWTYSCINCQRTMPFLRDWHEKYSDKGLTIIGVHTPEFEFEKNIENVQKAVDEFGIKWPVVLDNDFSTWRSYENRYWPRKYLIDIDGFIVYDHIGEGAYETTEAKIVELLKERADRMGEDIELSIDDSTEVEDTDFSQVRTPEIYFGHSRLEYITNLPNTKCFDSECEFVLPSELQLGGFALGGNWNIGEEGATLARDTGVITLGFVANKVNIVAGADKSVNITVFLDGEPIGKNAGSDVPNGTGVVDVFGLYNLVDLGGEYGNHLLEIQIEGAGMTAFTFTFG